MQQISLSSLNTALNQKDGLSKTLGLSVDTANVKGVSSLGITSSLAEADQSVEETFKQIFQDLSLSQENVVVDGEVLLKWQKLLNGDSGLFEQLDLNPEMLEQLDLNPEMLEQLDLNPEMLKQLDLSPEMLEQLDLSPEMLEQLDLSPEMHEQLKVFIKGQGLSTEFIYQGEVLPPLQTEGESVSPIVDSVAILRPDLSSAEATISVDETTEGLLDEQVISQQVINTDTGQGNDMNAVLSVATPFRQELQNDASLKVWGRFSSVTQSGNQGEGFNAVASQFDNTVTGIHPEGLVRGFENNAVQTQMLEPLNGNSLLPEADAQFKVSFESLRSASADAGGLLELNSNADRAELSRSQFSQLQSKVQDTGLKQYTSSVDTNVNDPAWGDEMSQKIVWLTGRKIQSAEIHLNPADLGPIEVKINVQNEQAAVTFHAQNNTVRDMLESNVQRLREMMDSNGIDLTEVSVGADESGNQYTSRGDEQNENGQSGAGQSGSESETLNDQSDEHVQASSMTNSIVDFYA